jgi:hypothetical protein
MARVRAEFAMTGTYRVFRRWGPSSRLGWWAALDIGAVAVLATAAVAEAARDSYTLWLLTWLVTLPGSAIVGGIVSVAVGIASAVLGLGVEGSPGLTGSILAVAFVTSAIVNAAMVGVAARLWSGRRPGRPAGSRPGRRPLVGSLWWA